MSSSTSSDDPIKIGYVRRAHGIKGAAIIRVLGEEEAQFAVGIAITTDSARFPSLTVTAAHPHKEGLLVSFAEVVDRNAAEELRGTSFYISAEDRRRLDEDEYWPADLVGLAVVGPEGAELGTVAGLVSGSAQDRIVVETPHGNVDVPFVVEIVTQVDMAGGRITVDPPAGLFEA